MVKSWFFFCVVFFSTKTSSPHRLSRSSSMASKQETDSDTQDLSLNSVTSVTSNNTSRATERKVMVNSAIQSADFHAQISLDNGSHDDDVVTTSGPSRRLLTNRSTTRSSSSSFSESLDPALDPSSLPPPDPWLESGNGTGNGGPTHTSSAGMSACRRDGHWFLKLLQAETARMEGWCKQMDEETKEHQLTEEGERELMFVCAAPDYKGPSKAHRVQYNIHLSVWNYSN